MRKLILLITILLLRQASFAVGREGGAESRQSPPGIQSVTGEQLEQILIAARGQSDRSVARKIRKLQLDERLSDAILERCQKAVPGKRARETLLALADMSAFLPPPASNIPGLPKPDLADQEQMLARTVDYVAKTLHSLPDFYARRLTTTFFGSSWKADRMHLNGRITSTVYYRDGQEVVDGGQTLRGYRGLTTRGVFGPILAVAVTDASKGNLAWTRWEQGATGPMAVYSYSVKAQQSHYEVDNQMATYSGEIAIDPVSGAILRLIVNTGVNLTAKTGGIEVEYGPVELGGKEYVCPTKSVAYSLDLNSAWVNDVVFEGYHLFRGEARILPGFSQVP